MSELTEYLASLPEAERVVIGAIYDRARELVPEATDGLGYGLPALRYRGKPLLAVKAARDHLGLYPFSPAAIEAAQAHLAGLSTSRGTVRFTAARPLPPAAIEALVLARRAEIER